MIDSLDRDISFGWLTSPKSVKLYLYGELASQAKFRSVVGGNLLQSWVNLAIDKMILDYCIFRMELFVK